jgi:hypothetical protein
VFRDGDHPFVLYHLPAQNSAQFSRFTLPYAGYTLCVQPEHVLVIQQGGGAGIPCALASHAPQITVVEQNRDIARIVGRHYQLPVVNETPRGFLGRSRQRFDIIHVENWGTSLPGAAALNQEHLLTIEAFTQYLTHLTARGVLIISRKLLLPPADALRLWATAHESLNALEFENPSAHMAVLRNWDTFTLLVSVQPVRKSAALETFARARNFDMVYLPDISPETVNRFNRFEEPYHFQAINRLAQAYAAGTGAAFFRDYPLDVQPQSDGRPFPSRFLKWTRLKAIYASTGSRFYSLLMSGEIVVMVVFMEALLVAILLLLLPLRAIPEGARKPSVRQILFFLSVGAGFMFVELFFIKAYTLLFGDPVISFTVVLAGILIFSGAGGLWSQRLRPRHLQYALIALISVLVLVIVCLPAIVPKILGFSAPLQYSLALVLLLPVGFLMGLPFPLAMRYLLNSPVERAYAWAANGCTSVLTSVVSAQIALSLGIPTIMAGAAAAYLLALLSTGKPR